MEEMKMTVYKGDSSAGAVYLLEYGQSNAFSFTKHVRIKILKPSGLNLANVKVSTYKGGRISDLKGATYNLVQGKVVTTPLKTEGIFSANENATTDTKAFTFPDVRVGSVIEYVYTMNHVNLTMWKFQKDVPVEWSELVAFVPNVFHFDKYLQGNIPASTAVDVKHTTTAEGIQGKTYRWILLNVPAFKEEPFMPEAEDCVPKIELTVAPKQARGNEDWFAESWPALNESILNDYHYKQAFAKADILSNTAVEITTGVTDPMKKIALIHAYLTKHIQWNHNFGILPDNVRKAVDSGLGSSSDINYLFATMLIKAEVPVDMVLTTIRGYGSIRQEFPSMTQFNYALCAARVNGKPILLDATNKDLPYSVLPIHCLSGQGFLLSRVASGFVELKAKVKAKKIVEADLTIDKSGTWKGSYQLTFDGYSAMEARKEIQDDGEDSFRSSALSLHDLKTEKVETNNISDVNLPVKLTYDVVSIKKPESDPSIIYFDPIVSSHEANPFHNDSRTFPIDFQTPIERTSILKLTLPADLVVDELPQSKIIRLPDNSAKFVYNAIVANNLVSITSTFQINKSLFNIEEYALLREFYSQVVAKQAEQIVLRRK